MVLSAATLPNLLRLLLLAFCLGIFFALCYLALRLLRRLGPSLRKKSAAPPSPVGRAAAFLFYFFTDLLFALFAAVATILFLFAFYNGKPRLSAIAALFCGFLGFHCLIGRRLCDLLCRLAAAGADRLRRLSSRIGGFLARRFLLPLRRFFGRRIAALRLRRRRSIARTYSERARQAFLAALSQAAFSNGSSSGEKSP